MEIEVGEYFRTKKKGIFKVLSIRKTPYGYYCGTVDNDNIRTFTIGKGGNAEIKNDIVKHSKNLIDLITKGDYINGIKVIQIFYDKKTDMLVPITADRREFYNSEIINSIVTKEQFRNMEYRLRD